MNVPLDDALVILRRTPGALAELLAGTEPRLHRRNEGPGIWSPAEVVRHLISADETSWIPRATIILEHGDAEPFPHPDQLGDDARFAGWTIEELLECFSDVRQDSLRTVESWNLSEDQLSRPGRHPQLGAVTLGQLFATWAVHDLIHLSQVSRVLARHFGNSVGVWRAYLQILEEQPSS